MKITPPTSTTTSTTRTTTTTIDFISLLCTNRANKGYPLCLQFCVLDTQLEAVQKIKPLLRNFLLQMPMGYFPT